MSEQYFAFYPHARLVPGAVGAALYDLFAPRVYWIRDAAVAEALRHMALGASRDQARAATDVDPAALDGYIALFADLGLGAPTARTTTVEAYRPLMLRSQAAEQSVYRRTGSVTVEISDECVYDCPWCSPRNPLTATVCGCAVWRDHARPVDTGVLLTALRRLHETGVPRLIIRGGEPFLMPQRLWPLLEMGRQLGMACEVHTTGQLIDERAAERLGALSVTVSLLLPGHDRETVRAVTPLRAAWYNLRQAVNHLAAEGVSLAARIPVSPESVKAAAHTAQWAQDEGVRDVQYLPYLPAETGTIEALRAWVGPSSPADMAVTLEQFFANGQCHPCFDQSFFIAADGRVAACSGQREPVAHLRQETMEKILREERLAPFYDTARAEVAACQACEFRYGCSACLMRTGAVRGRGASRALASARHWLCRYDPEKAEWETG
jgi:radical SAM protein with 4Fe4S-binding SPASM domain